ncbi:MAG TPA: N-formylglutamate amidohydrolase [Gammaproteobacteria bacterium]|nr:N-formylglutamate amidohydrolase [Gammaproteobacteria bacterium]
MNRQNTQLQAIPGPVAPDPLIGPQDPPPFEILNPHGCAPALVVCDHASRSIPSAMHGLGLDELALARHIAWDIGAGDLARGLAARLDAPAVLAGYSRLVVDCNRALEDPTAFPAVSDGERVPGNTGLSESDKAWRARCFYWPYHDAVAQMLGRFRARRAVPAFISIHSFTPFLRDGDRPWHVGILWDQDPRMASVLLERLRGEPGLCVGDNEPYSGRLPADFTVDHHAESARLPNVSIEVRQDLLESPAGVGEWVGRLGAALADILGDAVLRERYLGPEGSGDGGEQGT